MTIADLQSDGGPSGRRRGERGRSEQRREVFSSFIFGFGKLPERKRESVREREDSSVKRDRLRRRAATNEDALERVARAALSVYPHYWL